MRQLEQLMFSVSMLDSVSAPLRKIDKVIGNLKNDALKSFKQIGVGAAGMFASAYALNASTDLARGIKKSLGELSSLDVSNESLDNMLQKSLGYSVLFGENSKNFVASAYDIQSSIDGLSGTQLANITNASNILAKGTKSDAETITNYMGTMYGIFKGSAKQMGVDAWANNLAGMTAQSVKMFKTTGSGMSEYFGNLGAEAQSLKVSLPEQMAIGGMLQSTMAGSEAGTKYKSFLQGIGKAEKELGMKFTNDAGRMLPIVEVLTKIRNKFGDLDKIQDNDIIKKAFGRKEAVAMIKLLGKDLDSLNNNIDILGRNEGLKIATEMAKKMVDPVDRVTSGVDALRIAFGKPLSDWLDPYFNSLADGIGQVLKWTNQFPHLTKAISLTGGAIIGLFGVLSALALATGLTRLAMVGFRSALLILYPALWLINGGMMVMRGLMVAALFVRMIASVGTLTAVMGGLRSVILAVNIAMWANPVGFIIGGILLLTAGIGALIYYWDDLRETFKDNAVIMALMDVLELLTFPLQLLWKGFNWLGEKWDSTKGSLGDSVWAGLIISHFDSIFHPIDSFMKKVDQMKQGWKNLTEYFSSDAWSKKVESVIASVKGFINDLIGTWDKLMGKVDALKTSISTKIDLGATSVSSGVRWVKETVGLADPVPNISIPEVAPQNITNLHKRYGGYAANDVVNSHVQSSVPAPVIKLSDHAKAPLPQSLQTTINNDNRVTNTHVQSSVPAPVIKLSENFKKVQPHKIEVKDIKVKSTVPQGGLKQTINNSKSTTSHDNRRSGMNIGEIKIYPQQGFDAHSFAQELEMSA